MSDPFEELKLEVENSLSQLQQQISRAETESKSSSSSLGGFPSKDTIDELLLSLQATREDADLLRSACRSLRRRLDDSMMASSLGDDQQQQPNNQQRQGGGSNEEKNAALRIREMFCETTDAELDRIQLVIEDMQKKRLKYGNNKNSNNSTAIIPDNSKRSALPASPSIAIPQKENAGRNGNDDDSFQTENTSMTVVTTTTATTAGSGSDVPALVDIRNFDRDAAMRKIKMRQKRREEEEGTTLQDLEPKHDGSWKGIAKYYFNRFQAWAIAFEEDLTPNQRIGWIVGMIFVIIFLLFAVFAHKS